MAAISNTFSVRESGPNMTNPKVVLMHTTNLELFQVRVWGRDPETYHVVYDAVFTRHIAQSQKDFVTWVWNAIYAQMSRDLLYVPMIPQSSLPYQ